MAWACMTANGTCSLVCIIDEVFGAILFAYIQPNASELVRRRFTVQMDIDPNHTGKATEEFLKGKKWAVMQRSCRSSDLNATEHAFHVLKKKLMRKCSKKKQELETLAVETQHHQG